MIFEVKPPWVHCNITVIVLSNKMQSLKYIIYYAFVTVSIYSHKSMLSQIARFICIVINQIFSLDFTRLLCGVDGDPNNALRFVFGLPDSACGSWNFRGDIGPYAKRILTAVPSRLGEFLMLNHFSLYFYKLHFFTSYFTIIMS